jgi:hypothetical protein
MSACSNLGRDLPSRLAAYAGCVMLRARFRAQRTHQCALAIADSHNFAHCPNECVYQFGARPVKPFGRLCWICGAARIVPMNLFANVQPDRPSRLTAYSEQHRTTQDNTGQHMTTQDNI